MKVVLTPEVKSFPIKINSFGNDFCVIYFHGLLGSSEHKHVLHLIEDLNKNKIDNCSFDFFAHGARRGKEPFSEFDIFKYVEETKMVIHTLKKEGYKKFIFIGESLGGLLIQVLKSTKIDCLGIVFFCSVFDFVKGSKPSYDEIVKAYNENVPLVFTSASGASTFELGKNLLYGFIKFQEERVNVNEYQRGIPKLILCGKSDTMCNYQATIEFTKNFDNAKTVVLDVEHNGYDKDTKKYSYENTTLVNAEILKFINAVLSVKKYLQE